MCFTIKKNQNNSVLLSGINSQKNKMNTRGPLIFYGIKYLKHVWFHLRVNLKHEIKIKNTIL